MSIVNRPAKSVRWAAALVLGVLTLAVAPGCGSTPGVGSVDMGGAEGKDKIRPGELGKKPSEDPTAPGPKTGSKETVRSIKER